MHRLTSQISKTVAVRTALMLAAAFCLLPAGSLKGADKPVAIPADARGGPTMVGVTNATYLESESIQFAPDTEEQANVFDDALTSPFATQPIWPIRGSTRKRKPSSFVMPRLKGRN